jgi:hypothetical protein
VEVCEAVAGDEGVEWRWGKWEGGWVEGLRMFMSFFVSRRVGLKVERAHGLYPKNRTSLLISYHWTNKASPFTYATHALLYPC